MEYTAVINLIENQNINENYEKVIENIYLKWYCYNPTTQIYR